jgi:hypothetical protein
MLAALATGAGLVMTWEQLAGALIGLVYVAAVRAVDRWLPPPPPAAPPEPAPPPPHPPAPPPPAPRRVAGRRLEG